MRVLIVGSMASSLRNFRGALIEALLSAGHDVHAAAPSLVANDPTYRWLRKRGVTCHNIPLSRTGLTPIADLRTLAALYRLMRGMRPDVMLGYTIKPAVWGVLAAWMARVPQRVAMITGLGYAFAGERSGRRGFVRWIASHLYGIALPRATLVFFQNPDDRDDLRRWGILPSTIRIELVNGTGVDTEAFAPAPFPNTPPRFLLISRLLSDKGIREYAQAASRLRARYPQVEFHLVGPIDTNPQGLSEVEVGGWNDDGDLIWHGALIDVRPAIATAHVYVLPSYREGLPRTVQEAMSMGRAVITTNAPGCRETVQEGVNGFLVPVRDVAALEAAMEKFIRVPELVAHMGAESRRIAVEKYDVRKVNAAMIMAMGLA
jgi:glycosyltransferase involved in cell wall biosynthesis